MKYLNFTLSLLLAASALPVYARQLSPEEAYQRLAAADAGIIKRVPGFKANHRLADTYYDSTGKPCLYLFDSQEGFFILSADDCTQALLAYSDTPLPSEKEMPMNMRNWLQGYVEQISAASRKEIIVSDAPQKASSLSSIAPLVSTQWDQRSPYNNQCPYYDNYERCVTGCTATAAGQIMFTHKYPETGQGVFTHTDEFNGKTESWTVDFGATTYKWDDMTETYSYSSSLASEEAVSTLMKHLGVAFQMNYGTGDSNQSGATLANAAVGLVRNFNYSIGLCQRWKVYYSDDEWREMLYDELAAGRPMLYEGYSESGHAFVCDGYQADTDRFHFNWGWSGNGDGYYALSAMTPNSGYADHDYTGRQSAIFGIRKPVENDRHTPFMFTEGDIVPQDVINDAKTLKLGVINTTNTAFFNGVACENTVKLNPGLELTSRTSGEKYYISSSKDLNLRYLYGTYTFEIAGNVLNAPVGDYTARPVIRVDKDGTYSDWGYVKAPYGCAESFDMHVGKYYATSHNNLSTQTLLSASDVTVPKEAAYGEQFTLTADITAEYADYKGTVSVACRTSDGKSYNLGTSEQLNISKGEKIQVCIPCTLQFSGTDNLDICLTANRKVFYDENTIIPKIEPLEVLINVKDNDIKTNVNEEFTIEGHYILNGGPGKRYGTFGCQVIDEESNVMSQAEESLYFYPGIDKPYEFTMPAISRPGLYKVRFLVEDMHIEAGNNFFVEVLDPSSLSEINSEDNLQLAALSSGDRLLSGATPGEVVTVYSTDGTICYRTKANTSTLLLPSATWTQGIYIVRTSQHSLRFVR